ncbi:MAG TPA: hypothetical protein VK190_04960 [Pseudoneobacillus sp.]|nr:hypothetical protein [Pseudoneobacillus sp.]
MLGGLGLGMGFKAARVGDQIDAEVTAAKSLIQQGVMASQQLDFIETQLTQIAQQLQHEAPMIAMQFQNLVQQINNNQGMIANVFQQVQQSLMKIDGLTDKIQN